MKNKGMQYDTLALIGSLLIAVSAKIKVPMWPVDMSLQTLAIFTIGAVFWFEARSCNDIAISRRGRVGVSRLSRNTGTWNRFRVYGWPNRGYLVGYVLMVAITGWTADRGWWRNPSKIGAAMFVGELILLMFGALWLTYLFGVPQGIAYGVGPFVFPVMLKLALAAGIVSVLGNVVRSRLQ
jgi:biotin transport system substrate-specific component